MIRILNFIEEFNNGRYKNVSKEISKICNQSCSLVLSWHHSLGHWMSVQPSGVGHEGHVGGKGMDEHTICPSGHWMGSGHVGQSC